MISYDRFLCWVFFAVPSNIARKIIEDQYGNVQRAILGVEGGELNATASKALGINQTEGFYVCSDKNSGAEKSGLKRRYYQKWMVKRLLLMRTCLDISIPKDPMIKYR
jgi:S1-C subfamily serine protease